MFNFGVGQACTRYSNTLGASAFGVDGVVRALRAERHAHTFFIDIEFNARCYFDAFTETESHVS